MFCLPFFCERQTFLWLDNIVSESSLSSFDYFLRIFFLVRSTDYWLAYVVMRLLNSKTGKEIEELFILFFYFLFFLTLKKCLECSIEIWFFNNSTWRLCLKYKFIYFDLNYKKWCFVNFFNKHCCIKWSYFFFLFDLINEKML